MTHPLWPDLNQWCCDNGWTDLFVERYQFWAFPPGSVLPLPVPSTVLEDIHARHYHAWKYPVGYSAVITGSAFALLCSLLMHSPMPAIVAFACSAIAIGILDDA